MKKTYILCLIYFGVVVPIFAQSNFDGKPIVYNIGMPTGFTLNEGETIIGIGPIAHGVSNNIQIGSNVLLLLFRAYNVNAKISVLKTPDYCLAIGGDAAQFYLKVNNEYEPFISVSPFISFTSKIDNNTEFHLSGIVSHISSDAAIEDAETNPFSTGTSIYAGVSYDYSKKAKFMAETGYDATFDGFRLSGAALLGWTKFRLKLGLGYFNPKGINRGYLLPVIGLWWRFGGKR
jgi:hypothetical protein